MKNSLQLKISLDNSKPEVWRRIVINNTLSMSSLHQVIQSVMQWDNSHLHRFIVNDKMFVPELTGLSDNEENYSEMIINDLLKEKGDTLTYEYDFGDSWYHTLEVESVLPPLRGEVQAELTGGANGCPPEDCGGIPGYEYLKTVLTNPKHPEYGIMREWLCMEDDEKFDPTEIVLDPDYLAEGLSNLE